MRRAGRVAALAVLPTVAVSDPAAGACRQALVLGLDISGSVNAAEYRLQLDGLAEALRANTVRQALLAMPDAWVDLAIFEWSSPETQRILLPWITLSDSAAIESVAARLAATDRILGEPSTALGSALLFGGALLDERPGCWRRVLDLSGDGVSNAGPRPQVVRHGAPPADMVINGLVIGGALIGGLRQMDVSDLSAYFTANVIRGPDAFVEIARGYDDYARAMERKLLRELQVLAIGGLGPDDGRRNPPPRSQ